MSTSCGVNADDIYENSSKKKTTYMKMDNDGSFDIVVDAEH